MGNLQWKINYYITSAGRTPVKTFIDNLDEKSQAKVFYSLELLAEFGLKLKLPHAKKVASTPLWELRIVGQKSLRFFYIAQIRQTFLLLHGFTKKKPKTPKKEISVALKRLQDHRTRS